MKKLSADQITTHLHALPLWSIVDNQLTRTFEFPAFPAGIHFVDQVAVLAESASHHPDIDIRYTRVTLSITTHEAGGLTEADFSLAERISSLI